MAEPRSLPRLLHAVREFAIVLTIGSGLLAFLEVGLRLGGFEYHAPAPIVSGIDLIHRSHPYWLWEPAPGAQVPSCGTERINLAGFRGRERSVSHPPSKVRIVTLGDSSTFGAKVCSEQAYPAILERKLPGSEVLNFGVIGFTAFQGEKLLAGRVLDYRPDVILAAFGAFNEGRPAVGHDVESRFAIASRAPWVVAMRDRFQDLRIFELAERFVVGRQQDPVDEAVTNWQAAVRGGEFVHNQSVPSFEHSLETIVALGRSKGARVALIIPPRRATVEVTFPYLEDYDAAIGRVAARSGVPCWDVRASFRRMPDADESLFFDAVHPNVAGHRLWAQLLAEHVGHILRGEPDVSDCS